MNGRLLLARVGLEPVNQLGILLGRALGQESQRIFELAFCRVRYLFKIRESKMEKSTDHRALRTEQERIFA